jgi:pimeloyl-ACP methyl ester carboxylesterase
MPKMKVNDVRIYYEIRGEGFPLVMINGLGRNSDDWDPRLVEELSRQFKLVIFDNRGAGRTDISDREYTIKLFADDTAGLMESLGISKAHVLGLSMGGMVAQELVLNCPEKVSKLILCSTHTGGLNVVQPSKEVIRMLAAGVSIVSKDEWRRIFLPLMFTSDFIEKNPDFVEIVVQRFFRHPISREAYTRQLIAIQDFNVHDKLQRIKVPTLILHGRKDVLIPPENGSILADAIPKAKLVYFENSAHVLAEEMREALGILRDFLI